MFILKKITNKFNMIRIIFLSFFVLISAAPKGEIDDNPMPIGEHFEGDILLPEGKLIPDPMTIRSGLIDTRYRWPQKRVIYELDSAFAASERAVINKALGEIQSKTCIRFVQRTTQTDYIYVVRGSNSGCSSFVGRIGGRQRLNLQANGCIQPGIVAHEFIHAIGFYHEQSRTDRDLYVTINWSNIPADRNNNFNKYTSGRINNQGIPYDYGSIMHYGAYDFAINRSIPTIITPKGVNVGQRKGLSANDAAKIRNMYNC